MTALITPEGLARLDAALAWIDEHPEQHHQGTWMRRHPDCGTTYCLAGTVAVLAGAEPLWYENDHDPDEEEAVEVRLPSGVARGVARYAALLLGIEVEGYAADRLFYWAGDRADLGSVRDELAASLDGGS